MSPAGSSGLGGEMAAAPNVARKEIAARIKRGLSDAGITYDRAAEIAGVARSTIGRMVSGSGGLDLEAVAKLAAAAGVSLDAWVYGERPEPFGGLAEVDVLEAAEFIIRAAPDFDKASPSGKLTADSLAQLIVDRARRVGVTRSSLTDDEK